MMFSCGFLSLSLLPLFVQSARLPRSEFHFQVGPDLRKTAESQAVATSSRTSSLTATTPIGLSSSSVTSILEDSLPMSAAVDDVLVVASDTLTKATETFRNPGDVIGGPLIMAYYPDWAGSSFPPEKIDFARFDWIDFAFALPNNDFNLTWDDPIGAPDLLRRLVHAAHSAGKKVKLSVGGWTGSEFFSPAVATSQNRHTFVSNILTVYNQFELDGIDIDWEYPGHEGNPGNMVASSDSANFLSFLQLLRATLPPSARITAATQTLPFFDSAGRPLTDVSDFAKVLDWIVLMNYDVWGSSQTPGPNAPLSNACHNSTQPDANAAAGVKSWVAAKFPVSKLVLGIPAYGYIATSNATSLRTRSNPRSFLRNRPWSTGSDFEARDPIVRVVDGDGGTDGQVQFRDLVKQGVLIRSNPNNTPKYEAAGGFVKSWDECSSTPFLHSSFVDQVITYDDPESLSMKAKFVAKVGMLGVNIFDIHGDTDQWDLTDSVKEAMSIE